MVLPSPDPKTSSGHELGLETGNKGTVYEKKNFFTVGRKILMKIEGHYKINSAKL